MDSTTLHNLQSSLRRLVTESIGDTIAEIKKHLPEFALKYSALLLLESRLNEANLQRIEGTLSEDDLQLRYNQIRADLLLFINSLEVADFALPVAGAPAAKTGSLLYKIPTQMTLQKETKCVVRLAFEKESIIRNIELDSDVEIKSVRVAEVMQVELIDPTEPHPFSIRAISDEEQFIEKGDYSEWCFYVKPLIEGTFPLVLKLSVVEIVQGKERLRNLTYEESIQITATAEETTEPVFKSMGIRVAPNTPASKESPALDIDIPSMSDAMQDVPLPAAPAAFIDRKPDFSKATKSDIDTPFSPAPQPSAERNIPSPVLPRSRRRNPMGWMAAAASVLLIITVAIFSINNNKNMENVIDQPSNVTESQDTILPIESFPDTLANDSSQQVNK